MARPQTPALPGTECTGLDAEGLAVLAHELRGALTVISGYADLLGIGLPEHSRREAIEGIGRAVNRADALLSHALAASQTVGDAPVLADVSLVAEEVASEQRAATGRRIHVAADSHPRVSADADALSRAISNLVSNAAKYSPADTDIDIGVAMQGAMAVVEVADRGPGIPPAEKEGVFEPFARLGRDLDAPGSGLGLTIVRRVAEAAGGTVEISDRDGGGTVVRITLPVSEG